MMVTDLRLDEPVDLPPEDTVRVRMVERFPRLRHKVRQWRFGLLVRTPI